MNTKYIFTSKMSNEFAETTSKTVVIRSYDNGNSQDERRAATKSEAALLKRAIMAALTAIGSGYDEASAKATAEYFVIIDSGETHINTYDSVYIPICEFLEQHIA